MKISRKLSFDKTQNKKVKSKKRLGFTLLELLIVISIIGILVAVGAASYSSAQKKARNSRRKQDMKAVQNGLEQYYAIEGSYPAASEPCALGATSSEYFPAGLPTDPKNSSSFTYRYRCIDTDSYTACAYLEGTPDGNATNKAAANYGACSSEPGGCDAYCVISLQ